MARCATCNRYIFFGFGYRNAGHRFCTLKCFATNNSNTFCEKCYNETTDTPPGSMFSINLFGTHLLGHSNRCPTCHSVVQTKFLFLPVPIPLAKYRVLYVGTYKYIGRKIIDQKRKKPT